MLRKHIGSPHVAFFIFHHDLPELFDAPIAKRPPTRALLQNMLEKAMTWHASMLHSILKKKNRPGSAEARKFGALYEGTWRRLRKREERTDKATFGWALLQSMPLPGPAKSVEPQSAA